MKDKALIQSRSNRIFHWLFAVTVVLLLMSGFYLHRPVNLGAVYNMKAGLLIHPVVGFLATGVFLAWVYQHLITRSYQDVWFRLRDGAELKGLLKYYLFMKKKTPAHGRYNAGQKFVYTSWFIVFSFMFLTGIVLYLANFGIVLPFPVLLQKVRFYHYLGALWFLGTVPLHIYLAFTEDPAKLQAMFTGWVSKPSEVTPAYSHKKFHKIRQKGGDMW